MKRTDLKPHPLNSWVYGDSYDNELLESIRAHGILEPILVTKDGRIISGHRRWNAAVNIGLEDVPITVSELTDELDIQEAIIEANKQRKKTPEQRAREFKALKEIEGKRNPPGNPRSDKKLIPANLPELKGTESRTRAAEKVGMKHRTAEKASKVVTVIDALEKEGKLADSSALREMLNKKSVHRAYSTAQELKLIPKNGKKKIAKQRPIQVEQKLPEPNHAYVLNSFITGFQTMKENFRRTLEHYQLWDSVQEFFDCISEKYEQVCEGKAPEDQREF